MKERYKWLASFGIVIGIVIGAWNCMWSLWNFVIFIPLIPWSAIASIICIVCIVCIMIKEEFFN